MIPAIAAARLTGAAHRAALPLLVLGPSAGSSAATAWSACAPHLTDRFDVLAWDLPGQGHSRAAPEEGFTVAELAAGVLRVVDDVLDARDQAAGRFGYAGGSVGGTVGLRLALDLPDRIDGLVLLGPEAGWDVDVPGGLAEVGVAVLVADEDPAGQPVEVAGLVRRHLLGEQPEDADPLDPRSRAIVALSALAVAGPAQELAPHLQAARRVGLTTEQIREVLVQAVGHRGVAADAAGLIAQQLLDEERD